MGCGGSRSLEDLEKSKIAEQKKKKAEKATVEEKKNKFTSIKMKFNKYIEKNPSFQLSEEKDIEVLWVKDEDLAKSLNFNKEEFFESCYYYLADTILESGELDVGEEVLAIFENSSEAVTEEEAGKVKAVFSQEKKWGKFVEVLSENENIIKHSMNLFKHDSKYDNAVLGVMFKINSKEIVNLLAEVISTLKNLESLLIIINDNANVDDYIPILEAVSASKTINNFAFGAISGQSYLKAGPEAQTLLIDVLKNNNLITFAYGRISLSPENFKKLMNNISISTSLKAFAYDGDIKVKDIKHFFESIKVSKTLIAAAIYGLDVYESLQEEVESVKAANKKLKVVVVSCNVSLE